MNVSRPFLALLTVAAMTSIALAADPAAGALTVTMAAQNNSNETGTATLTQDGKNVRVDLQVANAPSAAQPAHVHTGSCANLGGVAYPLSSVVNGKSTTVLKNVSLKDLTGKPYAINVHKSADDLKTYVSCGEIQSASAAPSSPMP